MDRPDNIDSIEVEFRSSNERSSLCANEHLYIRNWGLLIDWLLRYLLMIVYYVMLPAIAINKIFSKFNFEAVFTLNFAVWHLVFLGVGTAVLECATSCADLP